MSKTVPQVPQVHFSSMSKKKNNCRRIRCITLNTLQQELYDRIDGMLLQGIIHNKQQSSYKDNNGGKTDKAYGEKSLRWQFIEVK
jgi:hypothetical protein